MKKVLIVYRENDLFKDLVPIVESELDNLGCENEIVSFNEGTLKEEIAQRLSIKSLLESVVISDLTVLSSVGDKLSHEVTRAKGYGLLDRLSEELSLASGTKTDETALGASGIGYFQVSLQSTVERVIKSDGMPEQVYIVLDKLTDHNPFFEQGINMNRFRRSFEGQQQAYGVIKQALVAAGIPEDRIHEEKSTHYIEPYAHWQKQYVNRDVKGNLFLVDRHVIAEQKITTNLARTLRLPMPTMYHDLAIKGELILDPEQIEVRVRSMIRDYITKN